MFSLSIDLNEQFEVPNFKESILNDYEMIKSIYIDNYEGYEIDENINENNSSNLDNISFKLNLKLEMEVDPNLIELVQVFKFSELLINSTTIGLPYWINFDCDFLTKTLHFKFYLFWMKKNSTFHDTLEELFITNLNQDSIFFTMIEDFKNIVKPPEKTILINWLQQMKEELIIHKDKILLDEIIYNQDKTKKKNPQSEQEYLSDEFEGESDNLFLLKARSNKILENSKQKQEKHVIEISSNNSKPVDNDQYEQFINDGGFLGDIITDRGSTFQAHVIKITSLNDVSKYLKILKTNNKIFKATHNILAYRVKENTKSPKDKNIIVSKGKKNNAIIDDVEVNLTQGFDEDGEDGAGIRLLGFLEKMKIFNVMVVVSRWFGGTLLGNDRFKHINDSAKNLINKHKNQFDYMAGLKD